MPSREEIMTLIRRLFGDWISQPDHAWIALYRLLLDYEHGVPRITDSNRLLKGAWRQRALEVQNALANALSCRPDNVPDYLDVLMKQAYPAGTQRMNPVGIAFACAVTYLAERFAPGQYAWQMEARIGVDVFPELAGFRRQSVDIVAFRHGQPFAVISSKWGIRHDRVRDPQEEADTYKRQAPSLRFYLATNEFDSARLQKVLSYPTIDGVFHVNRDLVWQVYGGPTEELSGLKDMRELPPLFPDA